MWIKICGITSLEDAHLAVDAGADAVGFVFAPSPRQMTPAAAGKIAKELPSSIEKIGVFVDTSVEEIIAACETAGLSGVQLHGEYSAAHALNLCVWMKKNSAHLRIVPVVHYESDIRSFVQRLRSLSAQAAADATLNAVLVDTRITGKLGGTGVSFDWHAAQDSFRQHAYLRLIAAGGLNPENVREAIQTLCPWGVDVSSGVESVPGRKDRRRVMEFIRAARASAAEFAEAAQR